MSWQQIEHGASLRQDTAALEAAQLELQRLGGAPDLAAPDVQRLIRVGRSFLYALLNGKVCRTFSLLQCIRDMPAASTSRSASEHQCERHDMRGLTHRC